MEVARGLRQVDILCVCGGGGEINTDRNFLLSNLMVPSNWDSAEGSEGVAVGFVRHLSLLHY